MKTIYFLQSIATITVFIETVVSVINYFYEREKFMVALKEMVEDLLRSEPQTRNSDIDLTIAIWRKYFPNFIKTGSSGEAGVWLKDIKSLPREDHVKRIRAVFQNDHHKYLPTVETVAKQRKINIELWRQLVKQI